MPCHSPTKTRVMRSLTRALPSFSTVMVSSKSAMRQDLAAAGEDAVARQARHRSSPRIGREKIAKRHGLWVRRFMGAMRAAGDPALRIDEKRTLWIGGYLSGEGHG